MITAVCPRRVESDLQYVCVYKSKRMHVFMCKCVQNTCEYLRDYLVCVSLVQKFICAYV